MGSRQSHLTGPEITFLALSATAQSRHDLALQSCSEPESQLTICKRSELNATPSSPEGVKQLGTLHQGLGSQSLGVFRICFGFSGSQSAGDCFPKVSHVFLSLSLSNLILQTCLPGLGIYLLPSERVSRLSCNLPLAKPGERICSETLTPSLTALSRTSRLWRRPESEQCYLALQGGDHMVPRIQRSKISPRGIDFRESSTAKAVKTS